MSRQVKHTTTALLLEGDTDLRFYRNLVDESKCEIYSLSGKANVIQALELLKNGKTPGVVAVIDADTDHLDGKVSKNPNVITTETRDVEGILFRSPAFEKVLNEYGGKGVFPVNIRDLVATAATPLGYLRWVAVRNNWTMDFKTLGYSLFIDGVTVTCNSTRLCQEVIRCNLGFARTPAELEQEIKNAGQTTHDLWCVARGHDMAAILAIAISKRVQKCTAPDVERCLRLAFELEFLEKTLLFFAFCRWQTANAPFIVLKLNCPKTKDLS